ncbi:MAG: glycosyltransferase family 8 protein [Rickettsiales bacterium]|jgi:lipopolysaccharide biosynthesis glycosyltransferase|nr:glycosyltransferase family 8 protein [Rickettsiales bacterium]
MDAIRVFYACDDRYAPLAAVSMASVLMNTDSFIEFFIMDCNMSEKMRRKILMMKDKFNHFSVTFIPVNSDEKFGYIQLRNYLTTACFARLLIPDSMPNLGKVVYLDCDTVLFGDIAKLYNNDMQGKAIAAVPDPNVYNVPDKRQVQYPAALLSDTHLYFNSGVMLIDCQVWRKNNMLEKLLEAERQTAATRIFNDQDVLNKAFDSNYTPLDICFNVKSNLITFCPMEEIVVRHYTGEIKPWVKAGFSQLHSGDFWFYAGQTPFFAEILIDGLTELGMINVRKITNEEL